MDTMGRMVVSWREEYSLQIDSIDQQHQALVAITRQLQEAMLTGRAREVQSELIARLVEYTRYHFEFEERLMSDSGYEDLSSHQNLHRVLAGQVLDLQEQIAKTQAVSSPQMLRFLRNWITDHILQSDRKFGVAYHRSGPRE